MASALLLVDIQNDFLPGGALAVPNGDEVVPAANRLIERFDIVVATQDWHPANHGSFAANHPGRKPGEIIEFHGLEQILWPVHCVANTHGAALAAELNTPVMVKVIRKGTDPEVDSYSGFFDNARRHTTGLHEYLQRRAVTEVYICGLATDYCVKHTALDACHLKYHTTLVADACRGVDLKPGDVRAAMADMQRAGVHVIESAQRLD